MVEHTGWMIEVHMRRVAASDWVAGALVSSEGIRAFIPDAGIADDRTVAGERAVERARGWIDLRVGGAEP